MRPQSEHLTIILVAFMILMMVLSLRDKDKGDKYAEMALSVVTVYLVRTTNQDPESPNPG